MKKILSLMTLLSFMIVSCQQKPAPFKTTLVGYTILFPKLAKQLMDQGFTPKNRSVYIDSTDQSRIEWLFNPYESGEDTIYKVPDKRQAYGINIYLKNKGNQLDSVKAALEKQYNQPFVPMMITETTDERHWRYGSAGYYCQINPDVAVFLRKSSPSQGDSWNQFNSLRIAIGYGLSKAEQERFATSSGQYWKETD